MAGTHGPGHIARFCHAPGVPDEAKIADYYFRAAHQVTQAGKLLAQSYYQGPIYRAYFEGCSNGGRMAYMEAMRFPEDFDGIIAGVPFIDLRALLAALRFQKTRCPASVSMTSVRRPYLRRRAEPQPRQGGALRGVGVHVLGNVGPADFCDGENVRLLTRRGCDWSRRYPAISRAAAKLKQTGACRMAWKDSLCRSGHWPKAKNPDSFGRGADNRRA